MVGHDDLLGTMEKSISLRQTQLKRRLIASHEGIQVSGVCEVAPVLSENTHPYGPKSDLKPGTADVPHLLTRAVF